MNNKTTGAPAITLQTPFEEDLHLHHNGKERTSPKGSLRKHSWMGDIPTKKEDIKELLDWIDQHYNKKRVGLLCTPGFHSLLWEFLPVEACSQSDFVYKGKTYLMSGTLTVTPHIEECKFFDKETRTTYAVVFFDENN